MFYNFLLTSVRAIVKNRIYSIINILGLAMGMAACILISQYVIYELSYDRFHTKADRIYRIEYDDYQNGKLTFQCAAAVPAVGPALKDNFPEVQEFTRLFPVSGVITYKDPVKGLLSFREKKMQIASPSVFSVFDFELLRGDTATALKGPNKAVISERAARKFFGEEDPINKVLTLEGNFDFTITGIIQNVPENSHIKFDYLFSYETLNKASGNASETAWGWYDFNTYILVKAGTDIGELQKKWDDYLVKTRGEDWKKNNEKQEFKFQPLVNIHLYSNLLQESEPQEQGSGKSVYFLAVLAVFILIIAWINYINLTTARSVERASEVGVRKVLGAYQSQLIRQFLIESFILNCIAIVIALLIVVLTIPFAGIITGRHLNFLQFADPLFWVILAGIFIAGVILSGLYPAFVLSSYKPIYVLKGKFSSSRKGQFLRKSLVVFQFAASVFLITGTAIVYHQLKFMMKQDLGININKTIVLHGPGVTDSLFNDSFKAFKTEILRNSYVQSLTSSTTVPGEEIFWTRSLKRLHGGPESRITIYNAGIDYDYIPAFNLSILSGRNFSPEFPSDVKALIMNRSMFNMLEFESMDKAINEQVVLGEDTFQIIGVIEDYHQMSLKNKKQPIVFRYIPAATNFFSIKTDPAKTSDLIASIKNLWGNYFPGNPIEYFYLDQFFNKQYEKDQHFGQVFSSFSLLAIFIACLGLSGLASFTTIQRTKEIGIRKTMGSTVAGIVILLIKDFLKPILIAIILSIPITWFTMENWLYNFPYRINIPWYFFVLSAGQIILLAVLTVSIQTVKSALNNPALSLRYE